jgi:hypothetical protein
MLQILQKGACPGTVWGSEGDQGILGDREQAQRSLKSCNRKEAEAGFGVPNGDQGILGDREQAQSSLKSCNRKEA